ncbi:MAG TPA: hypothetical protein VHZ25_04015 [Acidobacteriaceae bacterium]|nr:hypothetical protein [Acidobacteriaceae bacterium]
MPPSDEKPQMSLEVRGPNPVPHQILQQLVIRMKTPHGAELEIPLSEISLGGNVHPIRPAGRHAAASARFAICGNCGEKIELSPDPAENHHAAQQHRVVCGKRAHAEDEHRQLLEEQAVRAPLQLAAGKPGWWKRR